MLLMYGNMSFHVPHKWRKEDVSQQRWYGIRIMIFWIFVVIFIFMYKKNPQKYLIVWKKLRKWCLGLYGNCCTQTAKKSNIYALCMFPTPILACSAFGNGKIKKLRRFVNTIANDGWQSKKIYSGVGNWYRIFSSPICQSLYDVKPKAQLERCLPYCAIGN
jgi:hypothetical protein